MYDTLVQILSRLPQLKNYNVDYMIREFFQNALKGRLGLAWKGQCGWCKNVYAKSLFADWGSPSQFEGMDTTVEFVDDDSEGGGYYLYGHYFSNIDTLKFRFKHLLGDMDHQNYCNKCVESLVKIGILEPVGEWNYGQ